jgi:hypothetical protein
MRDSQKIVFQTVGFYRKLGIVFLGIDANVTIIIILMAIPRRANFAKLCQSMKTSKSEKYQYPEPSSQSTCDESTSPTIEDFTNLLSAPYIISRPLSNGAIVVSTQPIEYHRSPNSAPRVVSNDLHLEFQAHCRRASTYAH